MNDEKKLAHAASAPGGEGPAKDKAAGCDGEGTLPRIYVVPVEVHESLGVKVAAICWGSCGLGLIGGVGIPGYGSGIPCGTAAGDCPHFEREELEPSGVVELAGRGYEVVLRKLRAER